MLNLHDEHKIGVENIDTVIPISEQGTLKNLTSREVYKVWGIVANAREAASTVPVRLAWLHASNAGSVLHTPVKSMIAIRVLSS